VTPTSQEDVAGLARLLRARVSYDQRLGTFGYAPASGSTGAPDEARLDLAAPDRTWTASPRRGAGQEPGGTLPGLGVTDAGGLTGATSLPDLRDVLGECRRCKLAPHRTQIVFGVGSPEARLMFVGEGPGEDEDRQGEPFVGRAGKLLTEIITKGMRLRREDVYIANVVKCRPPRNRNPEPDEVAACEPFLLRQIQLIGPEVVIALGKFAAQTLLRTKTPISRLRGRWHDYHGIRLMPTFHPAYLLRNPGDKRLVWDDVKSVMGVLGIPVR
jgi:uracil-DNA glycosylase family 4